MKTKYLVQGTWIGIVTGIVLAMILRIAEIVTGHKVYTLLLNVDYIPIVKEYQFPEVIEVAFHLIVSIILCILLVALYDKSHGFIRKHAILFPVLVNTVIGLALYPTTSFSDRTPEITDMVSLFWWVAGHVFYGFLVGFMIRNQAKKNERDLTGKYM